MLFTSYRWQVFILYDVIVFSFFVFFSFIYSYFILNLMRHQCYSAEDHIVVNLLKLRCFGCRGLIAGKPD